MRTTISIGRYMLAGVLVVMGLCKKEARAGMLS
jgi:hypothetical protein